MSKYRNVTEYLQKFASVLFLWTTVDKPQLLCLSFFCSSLWQENFHILMCFRKESGLFRDLTVHDTRTQYQNTYLIGQDVNFRKH